jgi:type I restriction-modification system DNA methylase subunit
MSQVAPATSPASSPASSPAPGRGKRKTPQKKKESPRNKNKKNNNKPSSVDLKETQELETTQSVEATNVNDTMLTNMFNRCLDILRNKEALTGTDALRNLSWLLTLKMLEPHFGHQINIESHPYDFSDLEDEDAEVIRDKVLQIVRFSNLAKEKEENLPQLMRYLWQYVLSQHPTTKNVFLPGQGFDLTHGNTYKQLISQIHSVNLANCEMDVLGNAYQQVHQSIMTTSKWLGQFYSPNKLTEIGVTLLNPQVYPDGKIDTCCDPAMGTGGFLITYLRHILKQANVKGIALDWEFIQREGIFGKEVDKDTYQMAVSNMLISSGHMFSHLAKGNSLSDPITRKFQFVLANPPFGSNGLNYDDLKSALRHVYMPIQVNNFALLFLQAIIYMLEINGKGVVVMPYGSEVDTDKSDYDKVRQYLLKTCDLKEVIYFPSGIFTHTGQRVCIFFFVKKVDGSDVMETQVQMSKNKKSQKKKYIFTDVLQTEKVAFYSYDLSMTVKTFLGELHVEEIMANSYSLNYSDYVEEEMPELEEGIELKKLKQVCLFKNGTALTRSEFIPGEYPVIGSGQKPIGYHNEYNRKENTILCASSGTAGLISKYPTKVWASDCFSIVPKDKSVNNSYLYHYLKSIQPKIFNLKKGGGHQHVYSKQIEKFNIPIPSLEIQIEKSAILDAIDLETQRQKREIEENEKRMKNQVFSFLYRTRDSTRDPATLESPLCSSSLPKRKLNTSLSSERFRYFHKHPKKWDQFNEHLAVFESHYQESELPRMKILQDLENQACSSSCSSSSPPPSLTVIDLGCRDGEIAARFGLEEEGGCCYAFQNFDYGSSVDWVTAADLTDLSEHLPDTSAHIVILQRVGRHGLASIHPSLIDQTPLDDYLREVSRLLLPKGTFYMVDPCESWSEEDKQPGQGVQGLLEDYGFEVMIAEECEATAVEPSTTPETYKYLFFKCTKL